MGCNSGIISNCYATGEVSGDDYLGGLVGYDSSGFYTKSFWDNTVNPTLSGIGNANDPNVIGETTGNMQKAGTFTSAGWAVVTPIWFLRAGEYPRLWWEGAEE